MVSPLAPRPGSTHAVQLTWVDDELVAWMPGGSPAAWRTPASSWRQPQLGVKVLSLHLPGGTMSVLTRRLDRAALAALGELDLLDDGSPSVAWAIAVRRAAADLVDNARVVPSLTDVAHGMWTAIWRPLPSDLAAVAGPLGATMPPVLAAARPGDGADIPAALLTTMVDIETRRRLARRGWLPDLGDVRRPGGRAARLVTRALTAEHPSFRADGVLAEALQRLATTFADLTLRAAGQVVAAVRLRLGLPLDDGMWPLRLELVDRDDPTRSCPAAEIAARSAAALEFAGAQEAVERLDRQLSEAQRALAESTPWLTGWLAEPGDGVDVDIAASTLGAVDALLDAGVELMGPDALVRRQPTARGNAEPAAITAGRFGGEALVQWSAVVDGQPIDERVLSRAAEAGAELVDTGDRWVLITAAAARRALSNLQQHRADHTELSSLDLLRLAAELDPADEVVATGWLGDMLGGLPDTQLAEGVEPPAFAATLRPYQRRGLGWLQFLERTGFGGCLADDMGLGKTPTTLAHLGGRPGPHLVVCPLSVVHNWESEAARFLPLSRVAVHHGSSRKADGVAALAAANDIVLSTYATVTRDIDALAEVPWTTVVLDEAQAVKNPVTQAAKAVRRLPAQQRLALTGTPVENRLNELWSIMAFAVPGLLGSQAQFRTRYATPIERHRDAGAAEALRAITAPFLLRRTKADRALVPDLPDKVEQVAWSSLTHEQAAMYQGVVDQLLRDSDAVSGMRRRGLVLAALTRLKQICNHPAQALGDGSALAGRSGKLTRFDELVAQLLDAGERALVFTQFREMGSLLQRHCAERLGFDAPFLHGGVSSAGRKAMVERFQRGEGAPLLVVSLKAGGTGLNLTAASRVVHYDRWWNPAVEDQATDRAWRIGQQRAVFVHKLVCQGTIEERVDTLITEKRALADAVVGTTGEAWLSELSTDELRDLVLLDHAAVRG